jgi:hypothetical protein
MTTTIRQLTAVSTTVRHATHRVSTDRAASWTGRATTSLATDSDLPPIRSAQSHTTRVSAMRDAGTRAGRRAVNAPSLRPGLPHRLRSGSSRRSRVSGSPSAPVGATTARQSRRLTALSAQAADRAVRVFGVNAARHRDAPRSADRSSDTPLTGHDPGASHDGSGVERLRQPALTHREIRHRRTSPAPARPRTRRPRQAHTIRTREERVINVIGDGGDRRHVLEGTDRTAVGWIRGNVIGFGPGAAGARRRVRMGGRWRASARTAASAAGRRTRRHVREARTRCSSSRFRRGARLGW